MTDLWAEVPSPMKSEFRKAFCEYAVKNYEKCGRYLSSYVPAAPAGSMPCEDYFSCMGSSETVPSGTDFSGGPPSDLPLNILAMSYGEYSSRLFSEKFLDTGIYMDPVPAGFFPEVIVIDTKRLGNRRLPDSYEDLADEIYRGEICLIGSPDIPDPIISLYIYRSLGERALISFIENINSFSTPSKTLRHIGRSSNCYGSIFIMPVMFAIAAAQSNGAVIAECKDGLAAEPLLLLQRDPDQLHGSERIMEMKNHSGAFGIYDISAGSVSASNSCIKSFIYSKIYADILSAHCFIPPEDAGRVSPVSRDKLICDDLDTVWKMHRIYQHIQK